MNYTENYHLPQWEETDRIMRTDFNQMCADIEQGIATAQSTAESAAEDAAKLPYVVGTYTGVGGTMSFEVGFRPSFLIITGMESGDSANTKNFVYYFGASGGNVLDNKVIFTETGFILHPATMEYGGYPAFTTKDKTFDFIAFK